MRTFYINLTINERNIDATIEARDIQEALAVANAWIDGVRAVVSLDPRITNLGETKRRGSDYGPLEEVKL